MNTRCLIYELVLILILPILLAAQDFIGVNCGADIGYNSIYGDYYYPDQQYSPSDGFGYVPGDIQSKGPNRVCYGTERMDSLYFYSNFGNITYLFDVDPGYYIISVHTIERSVHWKDFRKFAIMIEGDTVYNELDIFEMVGSEYAVPLRFPKYCNDDRIEVNFIQILDAPTVSAISVRRVTFNNIPPDRIEGFETVSSYNCNILYWDNPRNNDFWGYNIYRREIGGDWYVQNDVIHPLCRYLDFNAEIGSDYEYCVTALDCWGNESPASRILSAAAMPPTGSELPVYEMTITDEAMYELNENIYTDEYVDAELVLEGEYFLDAGVRYRGGSSRAIYKKNHKLRIYNGGLHNARERFNLQSDGNYNSMLHSKLAYQVYDDVGLLNPLSQSINLFRNDEFIGVYLDLEQVCSWFLERNYLSTGGNIYRCYDGLSIKDTYTEYQTFYTKENNKETDWFDLIEFIEWLNNASDEEFQNDIGTKCDLDGCIDIYSIQIATSDGDFGYQNYLMYNNPVDGRWYFIAWDHDMTYQDPTTPIDLATQNNPIMFLEIYPKWNVLYDRFINNELFRYAYCKKLERLLSEEFSPEVNIDRINTAHQQIYDDALRDIYKKGRERPNLFVESLEDLTEFAQDRVDYLLNEIDEFITDPVLTPYFKFNEIQTDNHSTFSDEAGEYDPWVEIMNISPVELDMQDFILHYGDQTWVLAPEAVVDAFHYLILWLDGDVNQGIFHAPFEVTNSPGVLWIESRHGGISDSLVIPLLSQDQVWARDKDGIGNWVGNMNPTPQTTNTPLPDPTNLVINEFLARNSSGCTDPSGEYDDLVEIYNPSQTDTIPVAGLFLTDDLTRPTKWALPDTSILPQGFLVVWCDEEPEQGFMHAAFKLNGNGEEIGLYDRNGETLIDVIVYYEQQVDVSCGRYPDGSNNWTQLYPTPGAPNSTTVGGFNIQNDLPDNFILSPNFPNPFNAATSIRFALPENSKVRVMIYDILGREVDVLTDSFLKAGWYNFIFDGSECSSGIYFYELETDNLSQTRKMLLIK